MQERIENLEMQIENNDMAKSHLVSTPTLKAVLKAANEASEWKESHNLLNSSLRYYEEKAGFTESENKRLKAENKKLKEDAKRYKKYAQSLDAKKPIDGLEV